MTPNNTPDEPEPNSARILLQKINFELKMMNVIPFFLLFYKNFYKTTKELTGSV